MSEPAGGSVPVDISFDVAGVCACPACGTRFQVAEDQLAAAAGRVRCGACLTVFDAKAQLSAQTATHEPSPGSQPPSAAGNRAGQPAAAASASGPPKAGRSGTALPTLGALAAALLLVVNIGALQWRSWSQAPALRDAYRIGCELVGCQLPPRRSLAAIEVRERGEVRSGPPEALELSAELVNRARFRQPFPLIAVALRTKSGETFAEHRLEPARYLQPTQARTMAPGQAVAIALRVPDPGPLAADYTLALL